ncbi:hypothetical protein WMY93_033350 [Mugilogobius chulae]|uniref:Uncharacterized protein n=1 Tax=Mugilogobius chulae TaxID=88201 RepID=A0AAW0MP30_9GOBI
MLRLRPPQSTKPSPQAKIKVGLFLSPECPVLSPSSNWTGCCPRSARCPVSSPDEARLLALLLEKCSPQQAPLLRHRLTLQRAVCQSAEAERSDDTQNLQTTAVQQV